MTAEATCRLISEEAHKGRGLSRDQALALLKIELGTRDMYDLFAAAAELSRSQWGSRGEIYAQVGINFERCSGNCSFCAMGSDGPVTADGLELSAEEVVRRAREFEAAGADHIFLMTTADYDFERFLDRSRTVRDALPAEVSMVANCGDFGPDEASALHEAGYRAAYHVHRLREGVDTGIDPRDRLRTLQAIADSPLELFYCVEPIGPEHTAEELVDEMFRGLDYGVSVAAVMSRVPTPNTPKAVLGQISELELAKICAVTRLVCGDTIRAMGVHEPSRLALIAGANQIYAETGSNPRDDRADTSEGRGFSVEDAREMMAEVQLVPSRDSQGL
ncbi:MAG: radical SAM protein [Armatimonadota bacterium]|nr:radical SAM protein [Armatimonadota bacterium]